MQVKGLKDALDNYPEVCTNYDPKYVKKTIKAIEKFDKGVALFTLNMPIKCPGAPQKIMYLAEDYFRKVRHYQSEKFFVWHIHFSARKARQGQNHLCYCNRGHVRRKKILGYFVRNLSKARHGSQFFNEIDRN